MASALNAEIVLEARDVSCRLPLSRWTVTLAGLSCFALAQPRLARGQAEELPPEPAAVQDVPAPVQPGQAPSQAAASPRPVQAAPRPPHRPSLLFMPYIGFTLPVGHGFAGYSASPRFGALLGIEVTERLSFNVESDVDYVTPDHNLTGQQSGSTVSGGFFDPPRHYIELMASPLISFRAGRVRLGPRIGWFTSKGSEAGVPATGSGVLFGGNVGLFVPYRGVSIGGLLTGSFRFFTSSYQPGAPHTVGLLATVLL
jgi:hypothetical protein